MTPHPLTCHDRVYAAHHLRRWVGMIKNDAFVMVLLGVMALATAAFMVNYFAFTQEVSPRAHRTDRWHSRRSRESLRAGILAGRRDGQGSDGRLRAALRRRRLAPVRGACHAGPRLGFRTSRRDALGLGAEGEFWHDPPRSRPRWLHLSVFISLDCPRSGPDGTHRLSRTNPP